MDKYKESFHKRIKPKQNINGSYKVEPFKDAQEALRNAQFSAREKEVFFNEAYASILADYFIAWLNTAPHEEKARQHIYSCAMALGSVKEKLIAVEMYGKNIKYINQESQEGGEGHK